MFHVVIVVLIVDNDFITAFRDLLCNDEIKN